jgi:competence protein ComFB
MEIHNVMEGLVTSAVEQVAREDAESDAPRYTVTEEYLTDAVCYVLNRVHPRYVSSGRGFAHLTSELQQDYQLGIDLVRLAHEGLHRVNAVRRTFYGSNNPHHPGGPCYNFGTIKGRLLDGARFSPVSDVEVVLLHKGTPVEMFDSRWSNPYRIPPQTPGNFHFWPAPVEADDNGESRDFPFELRIEDDRYEPLSHYFTCTARREEKENRVFSLERDVTLPDLYLFEHGRT